MEKLNKPPLIKRVLSDKVYHWMMTNLPSRIMYNHIYIDTQHKMWIPKWGWSKKQTDESKKKVEELCNNLNFTEE